MEQTFQRELTVALEAASLAAVAVMEVYATDFAVQYKDLPPDQAQRAVVTGEDPVTEADRRAGAIIRARIQAAFPDDVLVSEEDPLPPGFERAPRCWYVDPLDGTKEFVARNGEFCVMIGLAVDGVARLGVVHVPALEGGYVVAGTTSERFAVRIDAAGQRPLKVSAGSDPAHAAILVSRSRRATRLDAIFAVLGAPREVRCGSVGLKIAKLAEAAADAYVHPGSGTSGPKAWDLCAPEAILIAAGGKFTNELGQAVRYTSHDVTHRTGVLASNGRIHDALVDAVARV